MSQRLPKNSQAGLLTNFFQSHTSVQSTPSISHVQQRTTLEAPSMTQGSQVSIQEPPPIMHSRRVSIQGPLPTSQGRRVSIQEPLPTSQGRRVSIQEPLPMSQGRRVSIHEPLPTQGHRVSSHESQSMSQGRRLSMQESSSTTQSHQGSIQELLPPSQGRRTSIHEFLPLSPGVSPQESPSPASPSPCFIGPDVPLSIYSRRMSNRESLAHFQTRHYSSQSMIATRSPLVGLQLLPNGVSAPAEDLNYSSHHILSLSPVTSEVLSSVTSGSDISDKSVESITWSSPGNSKETLSQTQSPPSLPGSSIYTFLSFSSVGGETIRSLRRSSRLCSLLPMGWRILHEAKKITRILSLVLSLAGLIIICLISLGQPWMHFQVPLSPAGDPAGSPTFPIHTILFVRCLDISCQREYDQNAYLLDCAWLFMLISSLTGLGICITLLTVVLFSNSSLPMLDFSLFVASTLTGVSMMLGVLFYLLQADEYLQEGMTYKLGRSFYLAWISIFFFLMTGFFSYVNYINFWSILALQAVWA